MVTIAMSSFVSKFHVRNDIRYARDAVRLSFLEGSGNLGAFSYVP